MFTCLRSRVPKCANIKIKLSRLESMVRVTLSFLLNNIKRIVGCERYEFRECSARVSGLEMQEIVHTKVLKLLVKLKGWPIAKSIRNIDSLRRC